ncbi:unnamed protein product [Cochlearia groenlandica]
MRITSLKQRRLLLLRFWSVLMTMHTACNFQITCINTSDVFNVRYLSRFVPPDLAFDSGSNRSNTGDLMHHHDTFTAMQLPFYFGF